VDAGDIERRALHLGREKHLLERHDDLLQGRGRRRELSQVDAHDRRAENHSGDLLAHLGREGGIESSQVARQVEAVVGGALGAITGAAVGFAVGGPVGAAAGAYEGAQLGAAGGALAGAALGTIEGNAADTPGEAVVAGAEAGVVSGIGAGAAAGLGPLGELGAGAITNGAGVIPGVALPFAESAATALSDAGLTLESVLITGDGIILAADLEAYGKASGLLGGCHNH